MLFNAFIVALIKWVTAVNLIHVDLWDISALACIIIIKLSVCLLINQIAGTVSSRANFYYLLIQHDRCNVLDVQLVSNAQVKQPLGIWGDWVSSTIQWTLIDRQYIRMLWVKNYQRLLANRLFKNTETSDHILLNVITAVNWSKSCRPRSLDIASWHTLVEPGLLQHTVQ
jgi:hypothetical protein